MRDLQAQSEMPASASEELDAANEPLERRDDELSANLPAAGPGQDQSQLDRNAGGLVAADEIAQVAAGEGKVVDRAEGLEEAEPLPSPAREALTPAGPPAEPPADPATVVGAVSKDESGARQREAGIPEVGAVQAFAAQKKPDAAGARVQ